MPYCISEGSSNKFAYYVRNGSELKRFTNLDDVMEYTKMPKSKITNALDGDGKLGDYKIIAYAL